ncbi:UNVERIFIED_CONTAM: hypothetical protein K2H54_001115 [Gekko kuhli]
MIYNYGFQWYEKQCYNADYFKSRTKWNEQEEEKSASWFALTCGWFLWECCRNTSYSHSQETLYFNKWYVYAFILLWPSSQWFKVPNLLGGRLGPPPPPRSTIKKDRCLS